MEWSRVLDFNIEKKWIQVLTLEVEKLTYKFYKKTAIRNIVMLDFKYHLNTSELNGKCIHEY